MDDQLIDELRMLRARAYGPDPDIHEDPSALSRLHDLERLARGPEAEQLPPKPPPPAVPAAAAVATPSPAVPAAAAVATPSPDLPEVQVDPEPLVSAGPADADVAAAAKKPTEEPVRRRKWTKKRLALTWLASLGVAVLVTATVTGIVSRRIQADPREIAVLGVDQFAEWPGIFVGYTADGEQESGIPEGGVGFHSFHGLSFFRMPPGMFALGSDQTCLAVVETSEIDDEPNSFNGAVFNGCTAGTFPATVEIFITDEHQQLPDELLEAFPEGTALQFVLDGDEVVVLSDQD